MRETKELWNMPVDFLLLLLLLLRLLREVAAAPASGGSYENRG